LLTGSTNAAQTVGILSAYLRIFLACTNACCDK